MLTGGTRTDTDYEFGEYTLRHEEYTPKPTSTPWGQFILYKRCKFIVHWNESFRERNKYVYELYIAVKNKFNGKPYMNPYNKDNIGNFELALQENTKYIFPDTMPAEKCVDAITELKNVLQKHISPYKEK